LSDFLFFEKSPLSNAEKHHNFQVTLCRYFDTANIKFDDDESTKPQIFAEK